MSVAIDAILYLLVMSLIGRIIPDGYVLTLAHRHERMTVLIRTIPRPLQHILAMLNRPLGDNFG